MRDLRTVLVNSYLSKDDTLILKGIAILFMLFLHLFDSLDIVQKHYSDFFIGDIPLCYFLCRAINPVSFYLILSGYGLFIVNKNTKDKRRFIRIFRLLISYWVIITFFIFIGHFLRPEVFPGDIITILLNYTTLDTSYSGVYWFLFPYMVIAVSVPFFIKLIEKYDTWKILFITYVLELGTSFFISRYGEKYLFHNLFLYKPFLCFHLAFPFCLGIAMAKDNMVYKLRIQNSLLTLLFFLLLVLRCFIDTSIIQPFFIYFIIIIFLSFNKRPVFIDTTLKVLGKHSTNMWFIHPWFCYHLFSNFFYYLKYPILAFVVLVILSLVSSYMLNLVINPFTKLLR